MKREYVVLGVAILLLLSPVGVVLAQTFSTHSATAGTTYQTNSGVTVTLGDDRDVAAVPFADDQTFADDTLRISGSDAQIEVGNGAYSGDPPTFRGIDVTGSLTVNRTDLNRSVTLESGDANVLAVREINVTDNTAEFSYDSDNGFNVTVTDVTRANLAAVDATTGEPVAGADATADGTATFDLPAGQREIRIQRAPGELEVRNELKPNQLVTENVSLRARLFSDNDTVIERPVTNGTVSLAGVPLDEPLVVTVKEENANFSYRRILLDSAIETSEIYILPENATAAQVRFRLRDDTGRFGDSQDTRFFVEKAITRDYNGDGTNTTRYQTISGDRLGADGEFPTLLVDSERYRLRVENDEGEQRVLGSYVVQGPAVSTIPIGTVEFSAGIEEGAALQTNLRKAPDSASHEWEIRMVYVDPEGSTDQIEISVTNSSGGAIRPTTTESIGGATAYVETYPITQPFNPEEDTATVTVEATQGFETETFTQSLGDVPDVPIGPLNPQLAELIGLASIVAVAGLLVIKSPALAAFISPGYAGLLVLIGIIDIPMAGVVLAGLVGLLSVIGSQRLG